MKMIFASVAFVFICSSEENLTKMSGPGKVNGTEISWSLELLNAVWFIPFMIIFVPIHILFLHGIRKEIFIKFYKIFMIVASIAIFILGMRGIINIWFGNYDISNFNSESKWTCIYLAFKIYGIWVEEIYKSTNKKEEAKEGKKNKGG